MAVGERDSHTGHMTTGHEWNGIKELNTPVPKPVYFFLAATALFSVVYWLLMPAWPTGSSYTKGLLGIDQRKTVEEKLAAASLDRASWTERIAGESFETIREDPQLMTIVRETGHTLFGDNCAACHGASAAGGPGYPNLVEASWLWGGSPEAVDETIRVGINSTHPDTRVSQMPAFGRDQILDRDRILEVVAYVRSLAPTSEPAADADILAAGRQVFLENCASCHGESGAGNTEFGAPDLTDGSSIHGGDLDSVFRTVYGGQQGLMPAWEDRLSPLHRKMLVLYLLDLRSKEN